MPLPKRPAGTLSGLTKTKDTYRMESTMAPLNSKHAVSNFVKVFPHEYKRVLGIGRSDRAYVPAEPVATLAAAEQVQHG